MSRLFSFKRSFSFSRKKTALKKSPKSKSEPILRKISNEEFYETSSSQQIRLKNKKGNCVYCETTIPCWSIPVLIDLTIIEPGELKENDIKTIFLEFCNRECCFLFTKAIQRYIDEKGEKFKDPCVKILFRKLQKINTLEVDTSQRRKSFDQNKTKEWLLKFKNLVINI